MPEPATEAPQRKPAPVTPTPFLSTGRSDNWWLGPLITAVVLLGFVAYANFRVFHNRHYEIGELLSPFFSPNFNHWFNLPVWLSPALLILPIPVGFRLTCYYYRKAYYRSIWQDPPACAVGEPRAHYLGENAFPLILQNLHRYFLYLAIPILLVLWYDVYKSLWPGGRLGVTVGTLVLAANTTLLTFYTLSCHSLRHLVGGKLDCFSCPNANRARYKGWSVLTKFNEHHMFWAWTSLFAVGFADFYVWMVARGTWKNFQLF